MDYVVFGIGFGATILVLGLLLRDVGPRIRYRSSGGSNGVLPADLLVAKVSWTRYCHALGAVLAIGGSIFLLTTLVSILLMLSDGTGGWVMLSALGVLFLMVFYWTWAYFDRFGSYGILPERPASHAATEPTVVRGEPPRQPAPGAEPDSPDEALVYGSALISAGDPDGSDALMGKRHDDSKPAVLGPKPDELVSPPEDETGDEDHARHLPLATPEERLARMEEPLDHGSAAGDLEAAPAGGRPASGRERRMGAAASAGDPEATLDEQNEGSGDGEDARSTAVVPEATLDRQNEGSRHGEEADSTPAPIEATLDRQNEGSTHGEEADSTSEGGVDGSVQGEESRNQATGQKRSALSHGTAPDES